MGFLNLLLQRQLYLLLPSSSLQERGGLSSDLSFSYLFVDLVLLTIQLLLLPFLNVSVIYKLSCVLPIQYILI